MNARPLILCGFLLAAPAAKGNSPHRAELTTQVVANGALLLEFIPSAPYGESGFTNAIDPKTGAIVWSLDHYVPGLDVCADAATAVRLYNLLDFENARPETVVMQLFRSGTVVGTLTLADLTPRLSEPSVWLGSRLLLAAQTLAKRGFDEACESFAFVTADGDAYVVDTLTGAIVEHFVDREALDLFEVLRQQRRP